VTNYGTLIFANQIPLNAIVQYFCKDGYVFSETNTNPGVQVTCQGLASYSTPPLDVNNGGFGNCIFGLACPQVTPLTADYASADFNDALTYRSGNNFT